MRKLRFHVIAGLLALAASLPAPAQESAAWYQGKPIMDIVFDGLKYVKKDDLEGVIQPFIGQNFSDALYWDLRGRLEALDYFEPPVDLRAVPANNLGTEMIIRVVVKEKPVVGRVTFTGNKGLSRNDLQGAVTIKANDVISAARIRLDEAALQNLYVEKGFPDAKVRSEVSPPDKKGEVIVTFIVAEGERIVVEAINFAAAGEKLVFSDRTLRSQLSLKAKGLLNDGAFSRAKLLADRQTLTQYYRNRGYLDAAVVDVTETTRKDAKENNLLTLTFHISEGRSFNFGGMTFTGNEIFSEADLEKLVYSEKGKTANVSKIEADYQRVLDVYFENGYIFNEFSTLAAGERRDSERDSVSYVVNIVERGRAHIKSITVRGNEKTRTSVILREIPLEPGDIFSKGKVLDATRNLYNLQYFSSVVPDPRPSQSADGLEENGLIDLNFVVEEQPTTDIQFGLTFSGSSDPDDFPISGLFKWTDKNFRGTGNSLGAELTASVDSQIASLEYTQKWLFGLPLSGGFDLSLQHATKTALMDNQAPWFNSKNDDGAYPDGYDSYDDYANSSKTPSSEYLMDFEQWYISLGFSTGYRWSTFLGNLGLAGGIRTGFQLNHFDDAIFRPFDETIRDSNDRWRLKNSIYGVLSLDQRDIFYDPSRGYYLSQRLGIYGLLPGESEHYYRTDSKAEWFTTLANFPVTDKWSFKAVFGIHTGVSMLFPQLFYDNIAVEDANMLAVDGMFNGRGWTGERIYKGLSLWENWAEVRIPLAPGIISWDFFADAAAVGEEALTLFDDTLVDRLRFSFGGGLRFAIPQMPFRFLFAKRFKIVDGEIKWMDGMIPFPGGGIDFVLSFALSSY